MLPKNLLKKAQAHAYELVEAALDADTTVVDFRDIERAAEEVGIHVSTLVVMVREIGATVGPREAPKQVRGFTSKSDRWSACPSHGGSGATVISGFAGNAAGYRLTGSVQRGSGRRAHRGWDYVFETLWLQKHIVPAWGIPCDGFGDVDHRDRESSTKRSEFCNRLNTFLFARLTALVIEPYSSDNDVFESDAEHIIEAAREAEEAGEIPAGSVKGLEAWRDETFRLRLLRPCETDAARSGIHKHGPRAVSHARVPRLDLRDRDHLIVAQVAVLSEQGLLLVQVRHDEPPVRPHHRLDEGSRGTQLPVAIDEL